jgi:hypothetical protein
MPLSDLAQIATTRVSSYLRTDQGHPTLTCRTECEVLAKLNGGRLQALALAALMAIDESDSNYTALHKIEVYKSSEVKSSFSSSYYAGAESWCKL